MGEGYQSCLGETLLQRLGVLGLRHFVDELRQAHSALVLWLPCRQHLGDPLRAAPILPLVPVHDRGLECLFEQEFQSPGSPRRVPSRHYNTLDECGQHYLVADKIAVRYAYPEQAPCSVSIHRDYCQLRVFCLSQSQTFREQCSSIVGLAILENSKGREVDVRSFPPSESISSRGKSLLQDIRDVRQIRHVENS